MSAKIAAISVAVVDGMLEANYARALRLAEISLDSHPDIILLPEAFAGGYIGDFRPFAEAPESSPHLRAFESLSRRGACMVVLGYIEPCRQGLRNAVIIYDRGEIVGRHYKSSLWRDDHRPYRDECTLLVPGDGIEVWTTRFGRMAVMICFENMILDNWTPLRGKADFVLSPYNCQGDPSVHNIARAKELGIASAWADRTGMVYADGGKFMPNMGTAGIVASDGGAVTMSAPGVENIVVADLSV